MNSMRVSFHPNTLVLSNLFARSAQDLMTSEPSRSVSAALNADENAFEIRMLKNKNDPARMIDAWFILYLFALLDGMPGKHDKDRNITAT